MGSCCRLEAVGSKLANNLAPVIGQFGQLCLPYGCQFCGDDRAKATLTYSVMKICYEKGESATKKKKMETIDLMEKHSPFPKAGVPSLFK